MTLDALHQGPPNRGQLIGWDGRVVPYVMRLLSEQRLAELTREADQLSADVRKSELTLHVCAESVRHPDTGAPLATIDGWRCMPRQHVAECATHYVKLAASERPTAAQLEVILHELQALVTEMRAQPAGSIEDLRVMFATELQAYYGQPAQRLSVVQVAYFGQYWVKLTDDAAKNRSGKK